VCACVFIYLFEFHQLTLVVNIPKKKLTLINNILEEEKPKSSKCYKKLLQKLEFSLQNVEIFSKHF